MYIGWQRCRVYQDFNHGGCFNCNWYGHSAKKCKNGMSYAHCAGEHGTLACINKGIKNA